MRTGSVSRFRKAGGSKAQLLKKTEESYKTREKSGNYKTLFENCGVDFTAFKPPEGDIVVDIVPFLAGSRHPQAAEGDFAYNVDIWVHYNVGVNKDTYICKARTYGERCPICEHAIKLETQDNINDDDLKPFRPKRRVIYNVVCYNSPEMEKKGVQIWDASHYSIESNIVSTAKNKRTGGYTPFAYEGDEKDFGVSIGFTREGSGKKTKYTGFQFSERPGPLSDTILDSAHTLDELLYNPSYEEVAESFYTLVENPDEAPETTTRRLDNPQTERPQTERPPVTSGPKEDDVPMECSECGQIKCICNQQEPEPESEPTPANNEDVTPPVRRRLSIPANKEPDSSGGNRPRLLKK